MELACLPFSPSRKQTPFRALESTTNREGTVLQVWRTRTLSSRFLFVTKRDRVVCLPSVVCVCVHPRGLLLACFHPRELLFTCFHPRELPLVRFHPRELLLGCVFPSTGSSSLVCTSAGTTSRMLGVFHDDKLDFFILLMVCSHRGGSRVSMRRDWVIDWLREAGNRLTWYVVYSYAYIQTEYTSTYADCERQGPKFDESLHTRAGKTKLRLLGSKRHYCDVL